MSYSVKGMVVLISIERGMFVIVSRFFYYLFESCYLYFIVVVFEIVYVFSYGLSDSCGVEWLDFLIILF